MVLRLGGASKANITLIGHIQYNVTTLNVATILPDVYKDLTLDNFWCNNVSASCTVNDDYKQNYSLGGAATWSYNSSTGIFTSAGQYKYVTGIGNYGALNMYLYISFDVYCIY